MRDIVLGPTFEAELSAGADEAERVLADWIRSGECPYHAARAGSHFTLGIREGSRHFWSPTLNMEVRETDGVAVVAGRFNPSNGIWAGYILTYLALLTISIGSAMWGTAELILGRTPWSMALIPACIILAGLMFWASAVGQRIARPEMEQMKAAVCAAIGIEQDTQARR